MARSQPAAKVTTATPKRSSGRTALPRRGDGERPPSAKQAVIIIHGMGEQVPLETIGDFVDTVYTRDPAFAGATVQTGGNLTSMVPDPVTGSAELRRITTHPRDGSKRTDFYELYYADIMDDNPLDVVTSWVATLLLRSPFRLPARAQVIILWLVLWALAVIVGVATAIMLVPEIAPYIWLLVPAAEFIDTWRWVVGLGAVALGAGILAYRLITMESLKTLKLGMPLVLVVLGLALALVPSAVIDDARVWAGIITFGVSWLFSTFVGPYFGDVVRFVRATPRTVERRRLVRERGLQLLRQLHDKLSFDGKTPEYDRIVIVGHSLGTMVAYDLLLHYWVESGPDHHRLKSVSLELATALKQLDQFVNATWTATAGLGGAIPHHQFQHAAYLAAQAQVYEALRKSPLNWRISDLITLGSPLVHSEFLVVDSQEELGRAFGERRFATSPPRPDPVQGAPATMLYTDNASGQGPFAHFAAPFSAVRWTNIHDDCWFPALGDVVSGPVRPTFGPAIWDHNVAIRRPGWVPLLDRIFTHTRYWFWHKSYDAANPPEHIALLRSALNLDGKRTPKSPK
jgi:hypothetical protein